MPEAVQKCASYTDAGIAACKWVEKGKTKVDHANLRLYPSTVGPYKGRVVGVGLKRKSGNVEYIVRIDNEDGDKGIHFNAKNESNTADKVATVITPTVGMKPVDRAILFEQYLHALENLSADTIWRWWQTGVKPTQ